jgi:peroxiredoxin Q/BCP
MGLLKKGDKIPDIKAFDQHGNEIQFSTFLGKKLLIYFYPKDDTPGCTAEACSLRDNYSEFQKLGYVVFGVSADSQQSHKKFVEKYELPFILLSDPEKNLIKAFGAWGEKNMYGKSYEGILRTTFLISETGVVENVIEKVNTKNHAVQVFETLVK